MNARAMGACAAMALAMATNSFAGVVATNGAVPYPQLVGPAGTEADPTVFRYDAYTKNFGDQQGLDIGTYNPYIQLHVVNQSQVTSSKIWFLGGDYPNKVGESQNPADYPGHQMLLIDNSTMSTGELRVGSKNSHNTLLLSNKATLQVGVGLYINRHEGVTNVNGVKGNAVRVTGGSTLSVKGGALHVGYGESSEESLSVTEGSSVTVGDAGVSQRLRMRFTHNSFVRVAGQGSKVFVTSGVSLGESSTYCYGNKLILEDRGEFWIRNAAGGAPLSSVFATGQEMNKVQLAGGSLVVHGDQTGNSSLANMIWVWDGSQFLDGTAGSGKLQPGQFSAVFHTTGDYAGYTVFTSAPVPEPATAGLLAGGGMLTLARRRRI